MALSAHYRDPILDAIARSIHALFPICMKCGAPVDQFEDADVRILSHRVEHKRRCEAAAERRP